MNSTLSAQDVLILAKERVERLIRNHFGSMPVHTTGGRWEHSDGWAPSWTGGFLTGMMWDLAEHFSDEELADRAQQYCDLLEPRKSDDGTHDIGFIFDPSWGKRYELLGEPRSRDVLITAGRTMADRLQEGGYFSTWVDPGSTFIDVMMNVGVVFRAAELSEDPALHDAALSHALTSRRYLVRGDGSTAHEGWFDVETGEYLRAATHQGWRSDSSWARGQAWAISGFAEAYEYTADQRFLDTSVAAARYWMENTPSHISVNDWLDPEPWIETSASAIAAAGMLRLAALLEPGSAAEMRAYARRIVDALCSPEFIPVDDPSWEGVLQRATYHKRNGLGVDESVMWGDYYLVEALLAEMRCP